MLLLLSLAFNLGILGFFKYYNFFAESLQDLLGLFGWQLDWPTLHIILPVGISFYTFQTLSYTIDIYRGRLQPTRDPLSFFAFVAFFPQLVAGPIERAANLLPQFHARKAFQESEVVGGLRLVVWGMFKKVVIADNLGPIVDALYAGPES
ncbi:MAG: MBOAT family protein, partial [Saprospiraceae bacterium]|nr:MBOAT family protein [Saprospiraceae bacterium]